MKKNSIHTKYTLADGSPVVGVTTVIDIISKPALIHWAWNLGIDGKDYRKVKEEAADVGTVAHYLIKSFVKNETPELEEYAPVIVQQAQKSLEAYKKFAKIHKLKSILVETPLVSEKYRFGGTPDWFGECDKKLAMFDYKTGNRLYPEMKLQVAAYKKLLEEKGHKVDEIHLIRLDKETGDFHHETISNTDEAWEMFKLLLQVYPLKQRLWK